ncbi:hypothetical protein FAVG1_06093 [Fusarium avenaceum]|nr:hypothetical protein FAVG1_06093 [Fusarium avenaceum]
MANISGDRQHVADSLSSSSLWRNITDETELTQSFETVSSSTQDSSDDIQSWRRFISTEKPNRLTFVDNALHEADGESSVKKRPMGDIGKSGHRTKRRMQRRGTNSGDRGEDHKGKEKLPPSDGPRYPSPDPTSRKRFDCPFHKHCPDRYYTCKGKLMPRISDVTNHLKRRHLLGKVVQGPGTDAQPQNIADYCPLCRIEFRSTGAEGRLHDHLTQRSCQIATIGQTGVMLPVELEELKRKLRLASDESAKWYIIWEHCDLQIARPSSPFVETTIPQTHLSGLSSVNYSMAGDDIGSFTTQSTHTDSLLTMNEPRIDAPIQTQAEQPAPRPVNETFAYPTIQNYNSTIPQLPSMFPSSSDNPYRTRPELIGSQAGQGFDSMDHGFLTSIAVQETGNLEWVNLVPSEDVWYQDDFQLGSNIRYNKG